MTPVGAQSVLDPRWQRIEEAVCTATELPVAERAKWLDAFCGTDAELRAEIDSLLDAAPSVDQFLEHSAAVYAHSLMQDQIDQSMPARIGQYRILREIGRGGMGIVYLGEREDEFKQQVAIKLVKRGLDTEEILRRFRNERQILASLNHPNIAKLFDGGMTEDGLPYFVMEYIEGESLTKYSEQHKLSINERLQLFGLACAAVQHAHQNLIVHRDLKPSNILVTRDQQVKLLDFGVAKLLTADSDGHATVTQRGQGVMTPQYASPEQIRGLIVTTATDVYSLGVVLYELLTGVKPYDVRDSSLEELLRTISETQPPKPSEARSESRLVGTLGGSSRRVHQPAAYAGGSDKALRGDLDNIVLMALRKDPERRYKSVEQLSEDLHRYLEGLPVIARRDTLQYRASKFVARNKLAVIATAVIMFAIIGGAIVSMWQARVAAKERSEAQQEEAKAEQLNKFLQSILFAASPEEKGKDAKVIDVVRDAAERVKTEFSNQPALKAQALLTIGTTYNTLGLGDEAIAILREALRLNSDLYGENSKEAAACMINLSLPLMNNNKLDESEALVQKGIAIERRLAPNSKELAGGLSVLGELYVRRGSYDHAFFGKAPVALNEALALFDKLEGPNNEDSAITLISLGRAHYFSGDTVNAETSYRKAIEIYRNLPPRFAGRLATALLNLGFALTNSRQFEEGIKATHEADDIFTRQGESFAQFESKAYLCFAYFNHNDYGDAIKYGQLAIGIARQLGVTEATDYLTCLKDVGLGLTRTGHAGEAEALLREHVAVTEKVAPQSIFVASGESALGECLTEEKKFAEAEPLIVGSYEAIKKAQGEKSALSITAAKRAVTLYEKMKNPTEAAKYRAIAPS